MKRYNIDASKITLDMLPEEGREIADMIGMENYLKLVMEYGGQSMYIHKLDAVRRMVRDDQIRHEFDGTNHACLCRKYDLSAKQIRIILADTTRQTSLFEK